MYKWIQNGLISIILWFGMLLYACNNAESPDEVMPRDITITSENAFNNLFFDSIRLASYFTEMGVSDSIANPIRSFYNQRNYQLAWFDTSGLSEHAFSFLQMQQQYIGYTGDSSIYEPALRALIDSLEADSNAYRIDSSKRLATELLLTNSFFRYASAAYEGDTDLNLKDLGWYIPRKKINLRTLLDSLVQAPASRLSDYEPVNRQYRLLKKHLLRYYEIQKEHDWTPIVMEEKLLRPGDSSMSIVPIRFRLYWLGDLNPADSNTVYDNNLEEGVKRYQRRHGLAEDGVIGPAFLKQLNIPPAQRIRQLLVNMERLRWVPAETPPDYLLVNIPAYQLFIFSHDTLNFSMNVVVGSIVHNTVIFRGDMKYIVFSPYWNVPKSIVRNEIEPALKKDKHYLDKNNMERYNGGIRQKPGPNNSLGLVKFLFPNNYNIYLHDTPAKSLFSQNQRAFSHGCIRLAEPRRLAIYLLRNDERWTPEKMDKAMKAGKETWVTLEKTVPVFIGYFTAWESSEGLLHFRDDVYGHDRKLADKLFR